MNIHARYTEEQILALLAHLHGTSPSRARVTEDDDGELVIEIETTWAAASAVDAILGQFKA